MGLSVEALAHELRIKAAYLAALEEGRAQDLPGDAYALGFIRTYAHRLNLDSAEILRRFKSENAIRPVAHNISERLPIREGGVPSSAFIIGGIVLAVLIWGIWYVVEGNKFGVVAFVQDVPARLSAFVGHTPTTESNSSAAAPARAVVVEAPAPAPAPLSSATATAPAPVAEAAPPVSSAASALPAPAPAPVLASVATHLASTGLASSASVTAPTPPPAPTTKPAATASTNPGKHVTIKANVDSWVQVRDGNTLLLSRVLKAGEVWAVPDKPGLTLMAGNAGGVKVYIDGEALPSLGPAGTVRRGLPLDPEHLRATLSADH